jgi:hypothetical protein
MFRGGQDNHPDNSIDYATKLSNLFSKGDIINKEIDETLDEAFRDNATKILLLRKQISNINLTQKFSNINLTQKFSNSIDSKLEEYNLVHFKLQKISRIRAFLIHAESKDFKNLIRDKKIVNIVKNLTIIVNLKSLCFKTLDKKPDLYDKIYLDLFSQYCNIYKEIEAEPEEKSKYKDSPRSRDLSTRTPYGNPLCSVTLPSVPSTQPRVRRGGIMPLIEYYRKLSEKITNGVKL